MNFPCPAVSLLVQQLEPKFIQNMWDTLTSNSITKYSKSKTLLDLFNEIESSQIKKLITGIDLGNL